MRYSGAILVGTILAVTAQEDTFNYRSTSGRDYGPQDWDEVSCNNLATCVSDIFLQYSSLDKYLIKFPHRVYLATAWMASKIARITGMASIQE